MEDWCQVGVGGKIFSKF